ncbi:hypothetical protein [Nocardioides sp. Leaf285]|uniref:hypothetical protein n=1 Tax=Nocardioides sp. Leaf285 TaxID=1736322 RepID=UPI0007033974|nr:hypothetical protein [Nocardioides sp. Leaf285]KQP63069.1 hypothetical protein ASF47_18840 [Nocardioides sp. Leaf285]
MQFTEHEMTIGLQGLAKATLHPDPAIREKAWVDLGAHGRWQRLDALGDIVLPMLVALPQVEIEPGARAEYAAEQYRTVAEARLRQETAAAGRAEMPEIGEVERERLVFERAFMLCLVVESMPLRQDAAGVLAAFEVPDHLPDDL